MGGAGQAVVDEHTALAHSGSEELGEDMADIGYTEEYVPAAWVVGDSIEDLHKANWGSDTAAMLHMDNHMAAAVDMEVMATAVMCVRAQSQIAFLE